MTFSSAFRLPSSWKLWNTKPTLAARTAARSSSPIANRSMPSSRTVPVVGVSSPAMSDSSVLLPDPDAPTMATERCARQGEIDLVENRQRAGGVLHALGETLDGNDGFGHEGWCASGGDVDAPPLARAL